jgi:folate-binding protein YgfZ
MNSVLNDTPAFPPQCCALPSLGLLSVSGSDAAKFLHGQTTCDVQGLAADRSTLGALCTAQGRVVAVFRLFQRDGVYYLLLPLELCETVRKRLQMFVLRADVKILNISNEWRYFGICGGGAINGLSLPGEIGQVSAQTGVLAIRVAGQNERYLLIEETAAASPRLAALEQAGFVQTDETAWILEDIASGIPSVGTANTEEFIPQMLNLDHLGGVSFTKGCYTGQEIVARTHYLGQVKRRMYQAQIETQQTPAAGTRIFAETAEGQSAGVVLKAALDGEVCRLLAVLNTAQAETGTLKLQDSDGPELTLMPLPYAL